MQKPISFKARLLIHAIFSAPLIYLGVRGLLRENQARHWPQATAVVQLAELVGGTGLSYWCPHIQYTFKVHDQSYTGNHNTIGTESCYRYRAPAESYLATHPVGSQVHVFYDPNNPNVSALRVSDDSGFSSWYLFGSGLIILALPLFSLRYPLRSPEH